ncbi:MAG TPA: transposase [Planctomycetaceae bacterium]|nr:transposase [Planctomycetaceae bacterium]HQZ68443.1 transposase [Planctomycetaceae bacterium]
MTFNLAPPPHFRGLDPFRPVRRYERHLPHWRQDGATYFVTFNLADALPANKLRQLESMRREWEHKHPVPRDEATWMEYARTAFRFVETTMDAGSGKCWLSRSEYAEEVQRSILHHQQQRYEVGCFVVMANHCHLTMRLFDGFELEDELGAIKRTTARFINQKESLSGVLWQQESYDRIIRDEEHLYRVVQYIGRNPHKVGIPREAWFRWMYPQWIESGWNFEQQ